jgi:transposase
VFFLDLYLGARQWCEIPRNGASTAKTRTKPVRAPLPPELERKERVIPVPVQECSCSQCGATKKLIGYETSERLASMPVTFYVEVLKREKRACARCEEMGVSTAPVPATIIEPTRRPFRHPEKRDVSP